MKRFLTPLPIGIVLADLIYGFVLNVMQGLNLQQTAANQSGTISVAIRNNFCGKRESHVEDFDRGCFDSEFGSLRIRQRRQLANVW